MGASVIYYYAASIGLKFAVVNSYYIHSHRQSWQYVNTYVTVLVFIHLLYLENLLNV